MYAWKATVSFEVSSLKLHTLYKIKFGRPLVFNINKMCNFSVTKIIIIHTICNVSGNSFRNWRRFGSQELRVDVINFPVLS